MALKDGIAFGMSLPHRSPDPIDMLAVRQVPGERRGRRFREGVGLIKGLWTESRVDYRGSIFQRDGGPRAPKPAQKPHPPIWLGGGHPDALRRAAAVADGWMGSGGSSTA